MDRKRRIRAEHFWWLGVAAWGLLVVLWRPDPPVSFLEAPSASPRPRGYAIFHDLLERETAGVRRVLGRASQLDDEVGVLVVLAPTEPLPATHRREMMDWVESTGGTLIVGHPIHDPDEGALVEFHAEGMWPVSELTPAPLARPVTAQYVPVHAAEPRDVPSFGHVFHGELTLSEYGAEALLVGDAGETLASSEPYGAGTVIQLAEADLLDNRALGWKQTHLFAAALLDEVGRDKIWAIDESHEGIDAAPSLVRLLGSGAWRPVLLQAVLLAIFLFWWGSARLGRPRGPGGPEAVREVTTLARDIGDFYFRAGQSRWALGRSLEYLKLAIKERGASSAARAAAQAAVTAAEQELARGAGGKTTGGGSVERHAVLIRKIALSQRLLAESSKGKRT